MAEKKLQDHEHPLAFGSYNHQGIMLRDALVMRNWLAYAATIEDLSYQAISTSPGNEIIP